MSRAGGLISLLCVGVGVWCNAGVAGAEVVDDKDSIRAFESLVVGTIARVSPAVVSIHAADGDGDGNGSGVVVSPDGEVWTVAHVAGPAGSAATVLFPGGGAAVAEVLPRGPAHDESEVVRLKLRGDGPWPHVSVAPAEPVRVGDPVLALGHPRGLDRQRPVVARLGWLRGIQDGAWRSDAPLNAGDSGGPLFDTAGRLLALHARVGVAEADNFHVPVVHVPPAERTGQSRRPIWESAFDAAALERIAKPEHLTVSVLVDGRRVALATPVLGVDGATWFVSVAGEIQAASAGAASPTIAVQAEGVRGPASVMAADPATGLALLRAERALPGVEPAAWSDGSLAVGRWVVSPMPVETKRRDGARVVFEVHGAVIASPARAVASQARLGVVFADATEAPTVRFVVPGSGADRAGVKRGDVITHIDNDATSTRRTVVDAVRRCLPGEAIEVSLRRGEQTQTVRVVLSEPVGRPSDRAGRIDALGGAVSARRSGFDRVWSHHAPLSADECGGPVFAVDGRVVGVNVARVGRGETLMLPGREVRTAVARMMGGEVEE